MVVEFGGLRGESIKKIFAVEGDLMGVASFASLRRYGVVG